MQEENNKQDLSLECDVCLTEIPASVAENAEADEYVSHFCGLDCYQQWRDNQKETAD